MKRLKCQYVRSRVISFINLQIQHFGYIHCNAWPPTSDASVKYCMYVQMPNVIKTFRIPHFRIFNRKALCVQSWHNANWWNMWHTLINAEVYISDLTTHPYISKFVAVNIKPRNTNHSITITSWIVLTAYQRMRFVIKTRERRWNVFPYYLLPCADH